MSLTAATGMNDDTGLTPCGNRGRAHRIGAMPGSFIDP